MKKILWLVVGAVILSLIAFLAVTKRMAEQRGARLDKENLEAQARIMDLETDLLAAKDEIAQLSKGRQPGGQTAEPAGTTPAAAQSASAAPAARTEPPSGIGAGSLVKYAATAGPGLTNLVRIEGTSSVHDWQVEGHLIGGTAEFSAGFPQAAGTMTAGGAIEARASVFIPVRSLKSVQSNGSPYSDAMDEIMYEKMLAQEHKRISFTLQTLTFQQRREADGALQCEATGQLGLAGQTNTVTMPVLIIPAAEGKLQITGSLKTKMTGFKITPPAPTGLGIKTGDDVVLKFSWWIKPPAPAAAAK